MEKKNRKKPKRNLEDSLIARFQEILGSTSFGFDLPKKWEKHGDLILLPESCFSLEIWRKIDRNDLWNEVAKYFGVSRIAKKGRICSDGRRTPQVHMLLGNDTRVCHIDNKIRYCYDVTKCMFSAGNITEKMRMARLDCSEEIIVDMFAGIGYFTLPLLVHGKAKYVHSCEWNPHAVEALKKNLRENKVNDRCTVYEGDNRKVCPGGVGDRVVMGLIPNAMGSIEPACRALKYKTGGVLHIHHNVESNTVQRKHSSNIPQMVHFSSSVQGEHSSKVVQGEHSSNVVQGEHSSKVVQGEHSSKVVQGEHSSKVVQGEHSSKIVQGKHSSNIFQGEHATHKDHYTPNNAHGEHSSNNVQGEHSLNYQQQLAELTTVQQHQDVDSLKITCNKKFILPEWLAWARDTASTVRVLMNDIHRDDGTRPFEFQTHILHIEKVKSYAPHIDHMVLDLKVEPCSTNTDHFLSDVPPS